MWKAVLLAMLTPLALSHADGGQREIQIARASFDPHRNYITPIAILRNGNLIDPVPYQIRPNERAIDEFTRMHYAKGMQFHLRQSTQQSGEVRLTGQAPGCNSEYNFYQVPVGKISVKKGKSALALSQDIGIVHPDYQRSPSADEGLIFAQVTQEALSRSDPSINPKTKSVIHHLVKTRSGNSGGDLLVGSISFVLRKREYWIFAIVSHSGDKWQPAIIQVHQIKDLQDRTDAQEEDFFDQLDINGDGTDEIFTESLYYEAHSFAAYGVRNGKWAKIYQSGIGGC